MAVIGVCGGLRLAPGEGVEFPRSLLQTEGVLGPLSIARTVATVHSGGTVSGPTLARHVLVSASYVRDAHVTDKILVAAIQTRGETMFCYPGDKAHSLGGKTCYFGGGT